MKNFCNECLQPINASRAGLTPRQRDCMLFIQGAYEHTGVGPSYDEIAMGLGLKSKNGINRLVVSLEQRGYVSRVPGSSRSIVPLVAVMPVEAAHTIEKDAKALVDDAQMAELYGDQTYNTHGDEFTDYQGKL